MGYKIYMPKAICDHGMEVLEQRGFTMIGTNQGTPEDLARYVPEADVVVARTHFFSKELLATAKHLKLLEVHGVGYQDHVVCKDAAELGIYVAYSPFGNFNTVAEGALALTLALTKHICDYNSSVRRQEHVPAKMALELSGATVGLLGFGNIASCFAQKLYYGMNAKIIAYSPTTDPGRIPSYVSMRETMDEVFAEADIVSLHIPGETSYAHMINAHHFSLMKPTAYFINTARDILVDNDALYDALLNHRIAGAAADVNYAEHPGGQKLLALDNFINTPHAMAFSDGSLERSGMNCVREICRVMLDKQEPKYWVNRDGFVPRG
ncbi:MAG: NAD(P)-dependent oxidoreductase [Oscillospiraceae bacterium]|nr:NAD(P)-dependent oxidoreductase [Oscillospiraceae bacterium]